jgi:CrcB protein
VITVVAFALVAALGALTRAEFGRRLNRRFPAGTMTVNVAGAFALGCLAAVGPPVSTVVGTTGIGALTTFSSFARDAVALVEERRLRAAALYVAGTVGLGLSAAAAGLALAPL